jgi:hypothetical protein
MGIFPGHETARATRRNNINCSRFLNIIWTRLRLRLRNSSTNHSTSYTSSSQLLLTDSTTSKSKSSD